MLGEGNGAGRPSELDDPKMLRNLRDWVIDGKNWTEIALLSGIALDTLYWWRSSNFRGFRDLAMTWNHEYMLSLSEVNLIDDLKLTTATKAVDEEGNETEKEIAALRQIKQNATIFIAETLGKDYYSKRKEFTGAGGAALVERAAVDSALAGIDAHIKVKPHDTERPIETGSEAPAGKE